MLRALKKRSASTLRSAQQWKTWWPGIGESCWESLPPTLFVVNKHIPRGYDECLVWGTIGWTIPLSRYPDTYNRQPICYVALSSQKNYCSLYLIGAFWSASQLEQLKAAFKAAGKKLDMGKCCVHFESSARTVAIVFARSAGSEAMYCPGALTFDGGFMDSSSSERSVSPNV
jgi:hypothetical protein